MIRSMTGYGRATATFESLELTVELKAVNNRYLDVNIRLPRAFSALEDRLKKLVGSRVSRGKLDVYCTARSLGSSESKMTLDTALAKQYIDALYSLRDTFRLPDDITTMSVARFGELFQRELAEEDTEHIWEMLFSVATEALDAFCAMREREGEALYTDFSEKLDSVERAVTQIEEKAPETVKLYRERLEAKLQELVGANYDDSRLLTEVALLSDRVAIDEELTRLRSHISQFRSILRESAAVGRKLDFLTQELNREVNTIGSKCSRLEITTVVVELKNELEKIREQIQNVE